MVIGPERIIRSITAGNNMIYIGDEGIKNLENYSVMSYDIQDVIPIVYMP